MIRICLISALLFWIGTSNSVLAADKEDLSFPIRPVIENSTDELGVLLTLVKANELKSEGDCKQASQFYQLASKYDPYLESAIYGLSACQIELGRYDLAVSTLDSSGFDSREAKILKVIASHHAANPPENIAALADSADNLKDPRIYNLLGNNYAKLTDYEQAKAAYMNAEILGQSKGVLENNLGLLALKRKDIQSAISLLSKAKLLAPQQRRFENNYRLALLLDKQYVPALKDLPNAEAANFLYKASIIAKHQGETVIAKTLMEYAINTSPTYFEKAEQSLKRLTAYNEIK